MPDDQNDVIAFLETSGSYDSGVTEVKRADTHCAVVFLAGDRAYKLKKSVRFSYLDFSTPEKRKTACEAEIALNTRTTPGLYIGLRALGRRTDGTIVWDAPEPFDWVIEMKRFPDGALLAELADRGLLDDSLCGRLADRIADHHDHAPVAVKSGGGGAVRHLIAGIGTALDDAGSGILGRTAIDGTIAALDEEAARQGALLDSRAATGHVRHCHGDLHLRNICMFEGEPTLFDALEFDPDLATIDVLYDLAFLLMDLEQRGLARQSSIILNRYLDRRDEQDGLPLLPLFAAMRAAIRAYTAAAAGASQTARDYLGHAAQCLRREAPVLIAIGGLSGSGKSSLGRNLAPLAGAIGGARRLSSDVVRKRLAGAESPETRLDPDHYTPAASAIVYETLCSQAARLLASSINVICDAVYARPAERDAIEAAASGLGIPFVGIWLEAPPETLATRIEQRYGDPSDATVDVLRQQLGYSLGTLTWRRIGAGGTSAEVAAAAAALIPAACRREFVAL